ncbi:MAG: phosphatase PAP2 family protein [Pseudomonadota bacterium]
MIGVSAAPAAAAEDRVPLSANFSTGELTGIAITATMDIALFALQRPLVDWRGEPLVGDPGSLDRSVSNSLYRPGEGRLLGGVPDVGGQVIAPVLVLGYYALDAGLLFSRGRSLSGDANADHELVALVEGYSLTAGLTQLAKIAIGRERPEYALGRRAPDRDDSEATVSFFSLHSSSSFCLAAFVWRDVSDWLTHERMQGESTNIRFWMGRVAPAILFYGAAALVGYSRIVDQKHYLSDVVFGALVGSAMGNLAYALHFDGSGQPRRRLATPGPTRVMPSVVPNGIGLTLTW